MYRSKPILCTLRRLVDMNGQCTLEEIADYTKIAKIDVLEVLHKNKDLLVSSEDDNSLYVGDTCSDIYRKERREGAKVFWSPPEFWIKNFARRSRYVLESSIMFKYIHPGHIDIDHPLWDDDFNPHKPPEGISTWDFDMRNQVPIKIWEALSDERIFLVPDQIKNLKVLRELGYSERDAYNTKIEEEVEEGKDISVWDE